MAGEANSQSAGTEKASATFHVPLSPNEPVSEHEDDQPLTAADLEPEPETAETDETAPDDDEAFPLDRVKYDKNDPVQAAAYEQLRKDTLPKWQKAQERKNAKHAAEIAALKAGLPQPAADAPREEAKATPEQTVLDDYYADPFGENWEPSGIEAEVAKIIPDDSDLAPYRKELVAIAKLVNISGAQHVLTTLRSRGQEYEQQQQQRTALGVIEGYMTALQDHPEYDAMYAQLAEIAPGTAELAKRNPQKWVKMAEALTGVPRDWQAASADDDEDDDVPVTPARTALNARRMAEKPQASMPRTTRAPQRTPVAARGTLGFDDAFDAAVRQHTRR